MTGEPDNVLREKSCLSRSSGRFIPGGCPHSTEETIRLWDGVGILLASLIVKSQVKFNSYQRASELFINSFRVVRFRDQRERHREACGSS